MLRLPHRHVLVSVALLGFAAMAPAGVIFDWAPTSASITGQSLRATVGPAGKTAEKPVFDADGLLEFADAQFVEFPGDAAAKIPETGFSVEAMVRVDKPQRWGCIVSSTQDNGDYERGWLLGYNGDRFCFKVSTGGRFIEVSTPPFSPGQWVRVAGVFDGVTARIHIDGEPISECPATGKLVKPDIPTPFVLGAYKDKDEFYPMQGRIRRVRIFDTPLNPAQIAKLASGDFPFAVRPAVRFLDSSRAELAWESTEAGPCLVAFGPTRQLGRTAESTATGTEHRVVLDKLLPNTVYRYRIGVRSGGGLKSSRLFTFDTTVNELPPDLSAAIRPAKDPKTRTYAAAAVKAAAPQQRGFCLVLGLVDGSLMREIARISGFAVVGVESDPARVAAIRRSLAAEGHYGWRLTVLHAADISSLPVTSCMANLVVSERTLVGEPLATPPDEVRRILRPGGGRAVIADASGAVNLGIARPPLDGAAEWTHQYADPANTACTADPLGEAKSTDEFALQWLGRPGGDFGIDRQPRGAAPLAVNGRLFHQGMNRIAALDAYNGQPLWQMEIPDLRRLNVPHDCADWCADSNRLYVAIRDRAWALDAATGKLARTFRLTRSQRGTHDWGYIACTDRFLLGSSVKAGAGFKSFWGGMMWYDQVGAPTAISVVCSDNIFAYDKHSGQGLWAYGRGLIVNSTITATDRRIWFVESRPPADLHPAYGRVPGPAVKSLWLHAHAVCLDAATGKVLWDRPVPDPTYLEPDSGFAASLTEASGFVQVGYGVHTAKGFMLVQSVGRTNKAAKPAGGGIFLYHLYNDADGSLLWSQSTSWRRNNHGAHISHPVVMDDRVYVDPSGVSLETGQPLDYTFGPRVGCPTVVGSKNALFFRGPGGNITEWGYESRTPTGWSRLRPSCWLNFLPAQGMMLVPEGGGGCSCGGWIETSVGFMPKPKVHQDK